MRVLHVTSSLDAKEGGPVRALVGLASAQARAGLEVRVFATFSAGAELDHATDALRTAGVRVDLLGPCRWPMSWHPRLPAAAGAVVAGCDVLHVHALWEEVQHRAARAAQAGGVPYVIRPCGMLDPWSLARGSLKKRIYMSARLRRNLDDAAAIHFTTPAEAEAAGNLGLRTPVVLEPNGVELGEFLSAPPRGSFRERHPAIGCRPMVLFLGRVHTGKGLELLIPAFARMRLPEAVLVVAGPDSDYRTAADAEVKRLGLGDRVLFTGMLHGPERVAALVDADVFCLPSHHENFGIAVVEALAAGTPVIVSDQVAIHPQVSAARVGGVVPLDVDALARELHRWLTDHVLRSAAAARAATVAREQYDWNFIAERWAGHYRKILTNLGPTPGPAAAVR